MTAGKTALSAVHAAVYGVLRNDATLTGLVPGGVWDHVPQDPTFPYVRLGGFQETPMDTMGRQHRRVEFSAHVWSTYRGLAEAYAIGDRLMALLRYQPLTLTGWTCGEDVLHLGSLVDEPLLGEGEQIQHLEVAFAVLTEEA